VLGAEGGVVPWAAANQPVCVFLKPLFSISGARGASLGSTHKHDSRSSLAVPRAYFAMAYKKSAGPLLVMVVETEAIMAWC